MENNRSPANMENRENERHTVIIQGRYRTGRGFARDVTVKDLSATGCRVFDRFSSLEAGMYVSVRIGSIGPIPAEVKWRRSAEAGVLFETPLHPSVLEYLRTTIEE